MREIMKITTLAVALFLSATGLKAQVDPHFSQYYVYPSWLNPALTGAFDGNYRVSGIYRSQWGNISSPFTTPGVAVDVTTPNNVNFGASVLKQTAGNGGYNYTTAYGNVAYTGVRLGRGEMHRIVFGIQAGMIDRRFDANKLTYGDQWNPITGTATLTSADLAGRKPATSFDAGAGVLYFDATPGKKANFFGGFSLSHLTQPDDQFSAFGKEKLPMRTTVHAGTRININESFTITPNALFLSQGTATEKMLGAYGQYKVTPDVDLLLGLNYRFNDAFSPYAGFTYKTMVLGVSYDVNTSELGQMAKGANSFEISLSFIGKRSIKTPEAEFVCPRL
jgi:type IX secretion system PorP/SprF family membrane protein